MKYGSMFYAGIGQVQNGCLYISLYRSSSTRNKAKQCKTLTDKHPMPFCCTKEDYINVYTINNVCSTLVLKKALRRPQH